MFNWFKKTAVKETPEPDVAAIQGGNSITPLALSESVAFKDQGNAHLNNDKLEEAAECFRQAIARNPRYAEAYTNLGLIFQMQGNLDEAIALYRKAVVFKPELLTAHMNLGIALMNLGQDDAAEESFRRVIALDPEHAAALQSLGAIALQRGAIAAQRGDFPHAETLLRRALELQPDYAEAHYNLGTLFMETKRLPEAEASFRRALELKPDYAEAHNHLGILLAKTGRLPEAEATFRRALELNPDYVEVYINLGTLLTEAHRLPEAEASYRIALELKPDYAEAHFNMGIVRTEAGRQPEAEASYLRALELKPDYAEAYSNLGTLLAETGRQPEAEASYRRALELKPDYVEAHINLGLSLAGIGRQPEAEAYFRRALELNPNYAEAHVNLGLSLAEARRQPEAEASYRRALELKPYYVEAHNNLGSLLVEAKRPSEAEASFRRALELKPDYAEAHSNLGAALQMSGHIDEAAACFYQALLIKPDYFDAHSNLIFILDLSANVGMPQLHGERKRWDEAYAVPLWQERPHTNDPTPTRRLRVGYVSADFREHSAAIVFGGMLTRYDRSQFDVFAYSNFKGRDDNVTELFRQNVTVWRNIGGLSDEAVAKMIREDRIDILVDLSGHTAGNRLLVFARKPAPIQITAWGYAHGTGMRAMDVFFTDPVSVPPQEKQYFSEEIRYLPCVVGSFFNEQFPDVNALPALSDGIVTFGSFNRLAKLSAETYLAWAEVLRAVPRSRLVLKTAELNDAAVRKQVLGYFTQAGVAAERIIMQGGTSWYEHMQAYNQVDIALDPFPHGGGVTALEGLMMGVPEITLRWPSTAGRVSASIMTALGLTDWIAETREQYVALAIQKGGDLQSLAELRQRLRGVFNASVIGNQAAYARAVEQEYRQLWQEWCARQSRAA